MEGRKALWRESDQWDEFQKGKYQVLHFGHSPVQSYRLGTEWPGGAGQHPVVEHEVMYTQVASGILACVSNGVASRSRAGIAPFSEHW